MGRSDHPAAPDRATAARLMWWLVRRERRRVVAGALLSSLWMVGLALPPYVLSRAVDDGLAPGDQRALVGWSLALLGVGVATAGVAWARHRVMSRLRMETRFRVVRIVVDQVNRLGSALPRRVAAGEVATIGLTDVADISIAMTVTGPGLGAVLAYLLIGGLLSAVSVVLAVVVLVGVPVLALVVGPLLRRLQRVQSEYRQRQSRLTARLVDVIEGLRVLNAFGGKQTYAGRYRDGSAGLREQGYRVGAVSSWIDALGVGLPAVFLGAVTWLAARLAAVGTITTGDLVAVYGYAAVLTVPVYFFVEGAQQLSRALVAAGRVTRFLAQEPVLAPDGGGRGPAEPAELVDDVSGVRIRPGVLTALVSEQPADSAAVLERLGRFVDSSATWGPARLDSIALAEVRRRILLADNDADVFAGTLREVLIGATDRDGASIARAVHTAAAEDVVQGLPGGLDARVDAHGRTVSGGQRQRLRLARAVLADPEVLLAVEPTSALDAHTEALVAGRLGTARAGRTTVLTSTSPLVLDRADCVLLLVGGRVAAAGGHRDLVREDPRYRAVVSRDDDG